MLSYWIDFGFSFLQSEIAWRFPIAFQIFFALVILAFILELPESPRYTCKHHPVQNTVILTSLRWLIYQGHEDEAINVLAALSDKSPEDKYIAAEFTAIKDTVLEAEATTFKDLFTMDEDRHFHRVALAYINQMFQQISGTSLSMQMFKAIKADRSQPGINLITYYAATIYENEIGLTPFISRILAACNGTEYFLASWIAVFIIEKIGRRKLMIFGATGMSLSMVILAVMTSIGGTVPGIIAAAFLFIFNTFFAIGKCFISCGTYSFANVMFFYRLVGDDLALSS